MRTHVFWGGSGANPNCVKFPAHSFSFERTERTLFFFRAHSFPLISFRPHSFLSSNSERTLLLRPRTRLLFARVCSTNTGLSAALIPKLTVPENRASS